MTKEEALKVLVKMRAWRKWGKEQIEEERPEMPEQKEVDEAFDVCIKLLQSSLPSNLDEAAEEAYPKMSRLSEPHGVIPADTKTHYLGDANKENRVAFKAGAEWAFGKLQKIESVKPLDWWMDRDGNEHCHGYDSDEVLPWPAVVYVKQIRKCDE